MKFNNKTFWITGAASGMGKATAIEIAKLGARIIISDRDADGLNDTAEQIEISGGTARIEPLDMTDTDGIFALAKKVIDDGEKIAGVYQFAGISQRSLTIETPIENDRKIMEINYFGVVALSKAVLPHMLENGEGQLAAASSLAGKFGFPYRSAYCASKHALHGFFETILAENYKEGIRTSIFIGGRIQTNISKFAINKEGKEHGKMDAGQANGITAEKAAKQIVAGLKKDKREIPVGGSELIILKIKRFFPGLHAKIVRKIKAM